MNPDTDTGALVAVGGAETETETGFPQDACDAILMPSSRHCQFVRQFRCQDSANELSIS